MCIIRNQSYARTAAKAKLSAIEPKMMLVSILENDDREINSEWTDMNEAFSLIEALGMSSKC